MGGGLVRWDLDAGTFERIDHASGLDAQHMTAVAQGPSAAGPVWVATDIGLFKKDADKVRWQPMPLPDLGDRIDVLQVAADGALFAGGPQGLARLRKGGWQRLLVGRATTAVLADQMGDTVWIGTNSGLYRLDGSASSLRPVPTDPNAGPVMVAALARSSDGGVLAVGVARGRSVFGFCDGKRVSWSALPTAAERPGLLRRARAQTLLGLGRKTYSVARVPRDANPTGELRIVGAPPAPSWEGKRLTLELPEAVTASLATPTDLYLGTSALGALRWDGQRMVAYRTADLTAGAERLTVACVSPDECYVATGGATAWWFDGRGFTESEIDAEPQARVLAVLRDPRGNVVAIHRGG
jgi:hypothetical protein